MAKAAQNANQGRNPFLVDDDEDGYFPQSPWDISRFSGLTSWGMFPGFGQQLQGALGQVYGLTQQNVARARENEQIAWQRRMEQAQLDMLRQQLQMQEKSQQQQYDLARQGLLAQMGYAADPSFLGAPAQGSGGNSQADQIAALMAARGVRVGNRGGTPAAQANPAANWSPQLQAQQSMQASQLKGLLDQIKAQSEGALALQNPLLASQERTANAQLQNALAQIQAQNQGALALQAPQLDAQRYIADLQAKIQQGQLGLGQQQLATQEKLGMAGMQNALDQIRATSEGQLALQSPLLASQERMNAAQLQSALDQINATGNNQLKLLTPQLQAQQQMQAAQLANALEQIKQTNAGQIGLANVAYGAQERMNSANLTNALEQLRAQTQGQLALQAPQLDYMRSKDAQEYGFKGNLVNAISNLFANNNPAQNFMGFMQGGMPMPQMPQAPQVQMPSGPAITSQMPKPGQGYTPSFTGANFMGSNGQQFGGIKMPGLTGGQGAAESGIGGLGGSIWNPQYAAQARSAFSSPVNRKPLFGSGQGMQNYWSDMTRSLGTQGMNAINRLGPFQQAKFNQSWQSARSGAQNDLNRLWSSAYSNWRNLDVGNRISGLRWLTGMYGG